jgi:predicted regulator of Ras-like GTPase activity (Roadblock/LC7/MglB family)
MAKLDQLMQEINNELGSDFYYMLIVGSNGLSIAFLHRVERDFDALAARQSMVNKLAGKVAEKLDLGEVDDNLITNNNSYVLTQLLGDGTYFAVLGLAKDSSLGVARMLLKEHAQSLWDAIPR